MSAPKTASIEALVDARIADLTRCRDHVAAGTCPILAGMTGEVTPEPKVRKASAQRSGKPAKVAIPDKPKAKDNGKPVQVAPPRTRVKDDDVFAAIKGSAGLTGTEVGAKFGVPPGNVQHRLDRLIAAGKLVKGGDKKYRIVVTQ